MMKDTSYRSKTKAKVNLRLDDGTTIEGFVFCSQGERVSDLLNDQREFMPFETDIGEIMMLRKATISSILTLDRDARKKLPSDPFEILGISKSSDIEDVKHAYHEKVRAWHPDRLSSMDLPDDMNDYANEMLARINSAYDIVMRQLQAKPAGDTKASA